MFQLLKVWRSSLETGLCRELQPGHLREIDFYTEKHAIIFFVLFSALFFLSFLIGTVTFFIQTFFIRNKIYTNIIYTRVVDPYSFFPDPDPEFEAGDQYGSGSNPDPGLK